MLLLNNKPIDYFLFSGGEFQVKLKPIESERATLTWKPTEASDIVLLMITVSALKHMGVNDIDLDILYLPYARQDRVCVPGEAHSLEVICKAINELEVSVVRLWDVHNQGDTLELLDGLVCHTQALHIFKRYKIFDDFDCDNLILCAPDDGSRRRVQDVSSTFGFNYPLVLDKVRDTETGNIAGIAYPKLASNIEGYNVLIIDDICDGGATFIEAAKILKEKGAKNLYLYITHGIFSKGLEQLLEYFNHIYCHHVLHDDKYKSTEKLTILREFPHVP